ncbi:hypothetical protein BSR29_04300 [Boudabousia liubingyangii]|uniref:Leucine rich repeat variant domain-containing protein n=1 Tax=Boudabousia liubingyangii TaxID=1921764 RepID=A0A1Q5PNE9_9ACTO|nr:hypothetical protein [Boudabousia liubingyangii]OKL49059.1 hypothetical protein BSR29_04300 [Boudabousia liubingyangii]
MSMPPNSQNSLPGGNGSDPTAQLLRDPNLDPSILAQIVNSRRDLWLQVAMHPRIYPELLQYLAEKGDPATVSFANALLDRMFVTDEDQFEEVKSSGKTDEMDSGYQTSVLPESLRTQSATLSNESVHEPKNKKKIWLVALVSLLLICLGGIGSYFTFLPTDAANETPYLSTEKLSKTFETGQIKVQEAKIPAELKPFFGAKYNGIAFGNRVGDLVLITVTVEKRENGVDSRRAAVYRVSDIKQGKGPVLITPAGLDIRGARLLGSNLLEVVRNKPDEGLVLEKYEFSNPQEATSTFSLSKSLSGESVVSGGACSLSRVYESGNQYISCDGEKLFRYNERKNKLSVYENAIYHDFYHADQEPSFLFVEERSGDETFINMIDTEGNTIEKRVTTKSSRYVKGVSQPGGIFRLSGVNDSYAWDDKRNLIDIGKKIEIGKSLGIIWSDAGIDEYSQAVDVLSKEKLDPNHNFFVINGGRIIETGNLGVPLDSHPPMMIVGNTFFFFDMQTSFRCTSFKKTGLIEQCLDEKGNLMSEMRTGEYFVTKVQDPYNGGIFRYRVIDPETLLFLNTFLIADDKSSFAVLGTVIVDKE